MSMQNAAQTVIRFDSCAAHGLIQRIRIWHGSNLLQDIDNYGLLAKLMFDLQVPTDACYGKFNVLCGTRNDLSVYVPSAGVAANNYYQALQANSGDVIRSVANAVVIAAGGNTIVNTYCLNLLSLVGTLCPNNYLPLFAMTSAPLRVEIQLIDTLTKAFNTETALTCTLGFINNVEYIANTIELGDAAMEMIESSLQGAPLQFVYNDFRNYAYAYQLQNAQTQVQMPIPAKFSSLKSIFITIRDIIPPGALTFFPLSSVTRGITDYQFRVGPTIMPPKSPNTYQEMFAECVKAIGSMSDLNYQPSIEKSSYTLTASVANSDVIDAYGASGVNSGSFYIGLDLENYVSAPKDSIFAGYNSNTDDIYAIMNFAPNNPVQNVRFDAFAMFDCVLVFEHNTAYVRF
jgi:hypothetical protein